MRVINLMLHDDWEIYGDGTGNPQTLMFEPAKRILDICDQYGAKYTFYAEIGQQLNMLATMTGEWRRFAIIWESILRDAVARGHDVQLHFHPQWIGAKLKNDVWQLDYSKWHSSHVDAPLIEKWIGQGKRYLENLLRPVDKDYQILSFRAGGWLCQPSTGLYNTLKKHGIVCDVSVMKGRYTKFDDGSWLDFRDAISCYNPWEVCPDNFALESKGSGVWELPVFTEESIVPHPFYLLKKSFRPFYYYSTYRKRKILPGGGAYSPKVIGKKKSKEYYGNFGYMHYKNLLSYISQVSSPVFANNKDPLIIL